MPKNRICLIAELPTSGRADEGMMGVAAATRECLVEFAEVLDVSPHSLLSPLKLASVLKFKPELVLYVPGPSILSLAILKVFKTVLPDIRTVVYCTHPSIGRSGFLEQSLAPDVSLLVSPDDKRTFDRMGSTTYELPFGVDNTKFKPVDYMRKMEIRSKLGLPASTIVLHVGPLKRSRNVGVFSRIAGIPNTVCVLLASSTSGVDEKLAMRLEESGVQVIRRIVPNIEEYYQAADVYVFPCSNDMGSARLPLSVLEALFSGCPVISARHSGTYHMLSDVQSIRFVDNDDEIIGQLRGVAHWDNHRPAVLCEEEMEKFTLKRFRETMTDVIQEIIQSRGK